MRWILFYLQNREEFAFVKKLQKFKAWIFLVILAVIVISMASCSHYVYKSEHCELSITTWSDTSVSNLVIKDCNLQGSAQGKENVALKKALEAAVLAAKAVN